MDFSIVGVSLLYTMISWKKQIDYTFCSVPYVYDMDANVKKYNHPRHKMTQCTEQGIYDD